MPHILSIEPINSCNLRCPFCFTGAGGIGRPRTVLSMALYRKLLAELGDYLYLVKAYNWGEPLLCPHLLQMIEETEARGIAIVVNTNLSLPLDDAKADQLIRSGLTQLVVSIDGATQQVYERYRVGGDLERVLANCRRLVAAKWRAGGPLPHLTIEFHPFPWNVQDEPAIRALATELGMSLRVFKGCVPGPDWDGGQRYAYCGDPIPLPCTWLWTTAVVAANGGIAPCNGTFYSGDDIGYLDPDDLARHSFRDVWNNERFQLARRFFIRRDGTPAEREHVCFECPTTKMWERRQEHVRTWGSPIGFTPGITTNDAWNYFWSRRGAKAARRHAG
jgi:MoaA/NifB/PqqE/SkfB family radical SAM enzyme